MKELKLAIGIIFVWIALMIGITMIYNPYIDNNIINQMYIQVIEKTNDSLKIEIQNLKSKHELPITIFTITRNNMQVVSSLGSGQDTFTKYHHYKLKDGINSDYVVLQEGQSFEWKIINY